MMTSISHPFIIHPSLLLILFSFSSNGVSSRSCECGLQPIATRIIHGRTSIPGQYPWVVFIMNRQLLMACSGVIVSERDIVTAAHCIAPNQDPSKIFVFKEQGCGKQALFAGKQLRVNKVFRHQSYVTQTGGNDIGLLHLQRGLKFNSTFMPICLSANGSIHDSTGDRFTVSGWGQTSEGHHLIDNDCLNDVEITRVPDWKCRLHYGTFLDTEKVLCAGGRENICNGDSGGPLMSSRDGRIFLTGITSFGRTDCGVVTRQPAAFERLSPHIPWIKERTSNKVLCFK